MGKDINTFYSSLGEKERSIAEKLYPLENEFFQIKQKKEEMDKAGKKFKAWVLSRKEEKISQKMLEVHRNEGNSWTAFQVWYKVKEYIFS